MPFRPTKSTVFKILFSINGLKSLFSYSCVATPNEPSLQEESHNHWLPIIVRCASGYLFTTLGHASVR